MCPGAESRGIINVNPALSKSGEDYHVDTMRASDGSGNSNSNNNSDTSCCIELWCLSKIQDLHEFFSGLALSEVVEEATWIGKFITPIIISGLVGYSRSAVSILYLGRLGKAELAGGSLAIAFGNVTGNSILRGLVMGMDPICCQAYGAKRWSVISQTFQKTLCLLLLVSIPISLLWLNMGRILHFLGQDPDVSRVAQLYIVYYIPELFAQAHLQPLRNFLRTQGLTAPLTYSAIFSALTHLPVVYLFTTYFKLGVKGVALSMGVTTLNMNIGLAIYVLVSDKPLKPWQGASVIKALSGWGPLLRLALPSTVSVCLEWWWYEIMLFLCGLLSNPQATVATMGILIQTTGFLYTFPYSLSIALTTRIGHAIGAGQSSKAQVSAVVGLCGAFLMGVMAFILSLALRSVWGRLFTDEPQVLDMIKAVLPILGLCEIGNWPQTAATGILTGTARPYVGARINMCAFYLIGLPVSVFATFVYKYGLLGLWYGMLAAQLSCLCMMVYTLVQTDWGNQAQRAVELSEAAVGREVVSDDQEDEESGLLDPNV